MKAGAKFTAQTAVVEARYASPVFIQCVQLGA
jgi:hypothetical protein